jgi:3-oxoacyl-[acyl-carrier-protein] synthase III
VRDWGELRANLRAKLRARFKNRVAIRIFLRPMRFENVFVESFAHVLPERVVTSAEIEARLAPIYERLRLSAGRLELMSGIRERRFFAPGTRPSAAATRAGAIAIEKSGIERERIGVVIHASVCRDFLEPATASVVHRALELGAHCQAFDLSNACLGFANAMVVVASRIEHHEIEAGLVVACEDGGPLIEATIASLLARQGDAQGETKLAREALKRAYASLTIGSGAAACVLAHRDVARGSRRLLGGAARAATEHVGLCHGDYVAQTGEMLMDTDSEALLVAGNALAKETWTEFERDIGWSTRDVERVVTHQVGAAHRRLLFATLGLDLATDFPTVESFGNIGSVSLPLSFSMGEERGFIRAGQKVAMLGIGSGLHCLMLAVH